jgi:hypothetical protein
MRQLIVHPGTGTVISADECLVLDEDQISEQIAKAIADGDDLDDVIVALAKSVGSPIMREI